MNIEELLKAAVEKKNREQLNHDRAGLLETIGKDITNALTPVLTEIAKKSSVSAEGVVEAVEAGIERGFKNLKLPEPNVTVQAPDVYVPEIKFPKIPVPQVNYTPPIIKVPEIKMPEEMDIKGWVQLQGVNLENPLPVQLRDANGKPVNLLENLTTIVGGSGGGGPKIMKVSDIANSAYGVLLNADNRLRISVETGGTGLTDTELRASSVPVSQASGANWSVNVVDVFATTAASNVVNPDNRVKVELVGTQTVSATDLDIRDLVTATDSVTVYQSSGAVWSMSVNDSFRTTVASNLINADDRLRVSVETGGSGLTDTELRATSVPVSQVSGAQWSVNVVDVFATTAASTVVNPDNRVKVESVGTQTVSATDLDIRDLVNATDSVTAYQSSGASWSVSTGTVTVTATDLDVRDLVNATDSVSVYQSSGASWSVSTGTVTVTATDLDIRDLADATDSVRVYQLSGATWSVVSIANSGVDIGDVDVTSVVPGTGATNLGKAEDAVHASADVGVMALSVRNSTNTTFASADGDYQPIASDGIGRVIIRPLQTRGLLQTAYISISNGTETTLLAGAAATYFDLVYVMATNSSDAAVTVDLRSATIGGIQTSIRVPANGTAGVSMSVPIPQDVAADTWTADLPDITGTTVTIGALFSREV